MTEENSQSNEQDILKRVFGMLDDKVRIYQILEEREVTQSEFEYCQIMFNIVFGEKGFAETLGPTWQMIHDPRFNTIEGLMIVNRHAIFGGDARLGKQYIGDDGTADTTISDLEKYAEIICEGRNFHNVLAHPDQKCQKRLWLERIYKGFTNIKPYSAFGCTCEKTFPSLTRDPSTFKDASDAEVWALIKQECPNRGFRSTGEPLPYGTLMFNLIRADLIGMIHDYAETPLIDSYVYLRDHGVVQAPETVDNVDPWGQEAPRVLQEIDILEQALTHRAAMRVVAYKLLKKIGFQHKLQATYPDFQLTDFERDELLRLIYTSDYPVQDEKRDPNGIWFRIHQDSWEKRIAVTIWEFVEECRKNSFEYRQQDQLLVAQTKAQRIVNDLVHGQMQPINTYTEPTEEIPADHSEGEVMAYADMVQAIMSNEFKSELYLVLVEAEKQNDTAVIDLLTPVFLTPDYPLDEKGFYNILESIRIGSRSLRAERLDAIRGVKQITDKTKPNVVEHEGEYHSKDNPGGMLR